MQRSPGTGRGRLLDVEPQYGSSDPCWRCYYASLLGTCMDPTLTRLLLFYRWDSRDSWRSAAGLGLCFQHPCLLSLLDRGSPFPLLFFLNPFPVCVLFTSNLVLHSCRETGGLIIGLIIPRGELTRGTGGGALAVPSIQADPGVSEQALLTPCPWKARNELCIWFRDADWPLSPSVGRISSPRFWNWRERLALAQ